MSNSKQVFASTEIVGDYLLSGLSSNEINNFKADPQSFILANTNQDFSNVSISVVENSANEINLVLPYYAAFDTSEAQAIRDSALDSVSGGEIVGVVMAIVAGVATAVGIGVAVVGGALLAGGGAAGIVVGAATAIQGSQGRNLDGSKKVREGK